MLSNSPRPDTNKASRLAASARMSTVVYRSRAVAPLSSPDLQHLMKTAQVRNQREALTGVVVYDDSRFFQWLEGPEEGVDRVMRSIRNDRRHTDLEVLAQRPMHARRFNGWDMKLAVRGADPTQSQGDVLEPPHEIVAKLHREPTAAPTLLAKLVPLPATTGDSPLATSLAGKALGHATASILKNVFQKTVIPLLLHRNGLSVPDAEHLLENPRAPELAELLVASDQAAALSLIRELRGDDPEARHLFAPLFEPAARLLGDLWSNDLCTEFEVTLGLCRLQTAMRLLGVDAPRVTPRSLQPRVLIAPVPGELHQLVAALDAEWLYRAGWMPQSEFPSDDLALADLLSASWVDVLDLSLSAAFRRADRLPQLARTVLQARRASQNPALVIVVGGRAFAEDGEMHPDVGANVNSQSSLNIDRRMLKAIDDAGEAGPKLTRRLR